MTDRTRVDDLLTEIVHTYYDKIRKQAQIWLDMGYHAYGIRGNELIACWPESAWHEISRLQDADLTYYAPVQLEKQAIGKVWACGGPKTIINEARLKGEATLISETLTMRARFEHNAAAIALIAQERIKNEIDMAAKIQSHLLPQRIPRVDDLDIYVCSRQAEHVCGDFYNFAAYKDYPLVFAIGDVSGKGLPAALLMAMTRIVLHTAARSMSTVDPKAILIRVNEDLYEYFSEVGMFATIFIGCYNSRARQLLYANAGHSPIVYCPAGGPATLLKADTLVLGVLPTSTCINQTLPLRGNDVLLAGTNSLHESSNATGEIFGYERLLKTVETLAHLPASQIGSHLLQIIHQFTRGYQRHSDQTLIVIKGTEKEVHYGNDQQTN
jgi:serine phosphatase RsbU (regulator of sigma subunit)